MLMTTPQSMKLNCKMVYSVITELNCDFKTSKEQYLQSRDNGGLNGMKAHGQGWELCLAQGKHSDTVAMSGQTTLTLAFCLKTRGMIVRMEGQLLLDSEAAAQLGHGATAESSRDMPPLFCLQALSPQQQHQLRAGAPIPSLVTASPHQPVRMEKADPKDKTVALAEVLRDPCLHSNHQEEEGGGEGKQQINRLWSQHQAPGGYTRLQASVSQEGGRVSSVPTLCQGPFWALHTKNPKFTFKVHE